MLALVVGCGRVAFTPVDDARVDAVDDVGTDAPRVCGTWQTPRLQTALMSPLVEEGPALSPDGLAVVFASTRAGGMGGPDLYLATRASPSDDFGAPTHLAALSSTGSDGGVAFRGDGLGLYFTSDRTAALDELYLATRSSPDVPFAAPMRVAELMNTDIPGPTVSADDTEMFYGRAGLARATRASPGSPWTLDSAVTEISNLAGYPSLSSDGLDLYFMSVETSGMYDIHVAHRTAVGQPFGPTTRIDELAGDRDDVEVSVDGQTLMFASPNTNDDLYLSTRICQ